MSAGKPLSIYFAAEELEYLEKVSEHDDCSKGYLVRRGLWLLRKERSEKARAEREREEALQTASAETS